MRSDDQGTDQDRADSTRGHLVRLEVVGLEAWRLLVCNAFMAAKHGTTGQWHYWALVMGSRVGRSWMGDGGWWIVDSRW